MPRDCLPETNFLCFPKTEHRPNLIGNENAPPPPANLENPSHHFEPLAQNPTPPLSYHL